MKLSTWPHSAHSKASRGGSRPNAGTWATWRIAAPQRAHEGVFCRLLVVSFAMVSLPLSLAGERETSEQVHRCAVRRAAGMKVDQENRPPTLRSELFSSRLATDQRSRNS
jgi:hypothetical protein